MLSADPVIHDEGQRCIERVVGAVVVDAGPWRRRLGGSYVAVAFPGRKHPARVSPRASAFTITLRVSAACIVPMPSCSGNRSLRNLVSLARRTFARTELSQQHDPSMVGSSMTGNR